MTWIKICGITNLEDAQTAVDAGADALGFVFYEKSPRKIDVETARDIVKQLPTNIEKVGVFVDLEASRIEETVHRAGLTAVQLHGEFSQRFWSDVQSPVEWAGGVKLIVAISADMLRAGDVLLNEPDRKKLYAILIDSRVSGIAGGTGTTFDWGATRGAVATIRLSAPVIVAGGLTPGNVGEAIKLFQPFGVDVASGVEARPGKKDPAKIRAFVSAVRAAGKVT